MREKVLSTYKGARFIGSQDRSKFAVCTVVQSRTQLPGAARVEQRRFFFEAKGQKNPLPRKIESKMRRNTTAKGGSESCWASKITVMLTRKARSRNASRCVGSQSRGDGKLITLDRMR